MLDCKPYCEQSSHRYRMYCIAHVMHEMSTAVWFTVVSNAVVVVVVVV